MRQSVKWFESTLETILVIPAKPGIARRRAGILLVAMVIAMLCGFSMAQARETLTLSEVKWLEHACASDAKYRQYYWWECNQLLGKQAKHGDKLPNDLQELKNYYALSQLQRARAQAEMTFMAPPFLSETMAAGFWEHQAHNIAKPLKKIYENYFTDWNILLRPGVADKEHFLQTHLENFCSASEAKVGLCIAKNQQASPQDMNASTLFANNVLANRDVQDAASIYIRNLTNPVPVPLLPADLLFKNAKKRILTKDGKENLSAKYRQQTLVSLAQESYLTMLAERMPYQDLNAEQASATQPQDPTSRLSVLAKEANRRFNDMDWYKEMNTASTEALLREVANMMALQLVVDFRSSLRQERMEALMAAQVAYLAQLIGSGETARQAVAQLAPPDKAS